MLFRSTVDKVVGISIDFKGKPYIKGADLSDYPDMVEIFTEIINCKSVMKLGNGKDKRYHTSQYKNYNTIVEYKTIGGSILMNLTDGEQYFVHKQFKKEVIDDVTEYLGELYPAFVLEWFTDETGSKPFDIVMPPYPIQDAEQKDGLRLEKVADLWDMEIFQANELNKKLYIMVSKTEHMKFAYIVRDFDLKSLDSIMKSKILRWHKSTGEDKIDHAILQSVLL